MMVIFFVAKNSHKGKV